MIVVLPLINIKVSLAAPPKTSLTDLLPLELSKNSKLPDPGIIVTFLAI
jgi:hypothetical protein